MNPRKWLVTLAVVLALGAGLYGQGTFAIKNAKIVTVSGETIEKGTVVVKDGLISAVGAKVSVPSRAKVIQGKGLVVYPGLFNAATQMGLTEIGAAPLTNDYSEMGEYMPHLLAFTAVHVESEHIPVARVDGITHVATMPSGGTIPGQAALIHMAGWSPEEMEIERQAAMVLEFPSLLPLRSRGFGFGGGRSQSQSDRQKDFEKKISELKTLFAKTEHYRKARESGADITPDKQFEALIPVVTGRQLVVIQADSHVDIKEAVKFAEGQGLNFVLSGAADAWKVADFLAEKNVRVILGPTQRLPFREDDPIDIMYRAPSILHEKGVRFAFSTGGASDARTLPFETGNAVAYGLDYDAALRAITLTPAEFFGFSEKLGSVDEGKIANLIVADGDILEYQTKIHHVFIQGAPVEMESKHTRLYKKYIARP